MVTDSTRIIPVSDKNKVKTITKMVDGSLKVEFHSGEVTMIDKDDDKIQAFIVYSILADL